MNTSHPQLKNLTAKEDKRDETVFLHSHVESSQPAPRFCAFSKRELIALHDSIASRYCDIFDPVSNIHAVLVNKKVKHAFSMSNTCIMGELDERDQNWTQSEIRISKSCITLIFQHIEDSSKIHFVFDIPSTNKA